MGKSKTQICEGCQRATGLCIDYVVCPWARELKPVDGWVANRIDVEEIEWSYDIISCPLFIKDMPKQKYSNDFLSNWKKFQYAIKNYI